MDFLVSRTNPAAHEWSAAPKTSSSSLQPGHALLQVESFALTSNVIGYAAAGELLKYFDFFPVDSNVMGRVPTWGISRVVKSNTKLLTVGQRFYGMVPITTTMGFIVQPMGSGGSFVDIAPHRKDRDVVYNTYVETNTQTDPLYPGATYEKEMILLRPLFLTAWLLRETVHDLKCTCLMITSASSKTGVALAWCMKKARATCNDIVGFTSQANLPYLQALGVYDRLITYDEITGNMAMTTTPTTCIVDLAGNVSLLKKIQSQFEPTCILVVGATHIQSSDLNVSLTGRGFRSDLPKPVFFFAPKAASKLIKDIGNHEFQMRSARDFHAFVRESQLQVNFAISPQSVERVFEGFVRGTIPAHESWIGMLTDHSNTANL